MPPHTLTRTTKLIEHVRQNPPLLRYPSNFDMGRRLAFATCTFACTRWLRSLNQYIKQCTMCSRRWYVGGSSCIAVQCMMYSVASEVSRMIARASVSCWVWFAQSPIRYVFRRIEVMHTSGCDPRHACEWLRYASVRLRNYRVWCCAGFVLQHQREMQRAYHVSAGCGVSAFIQYSWCLAMQAITCVWICMGWRWVCAFLLAGRRLFIAPGL